MPDGRISPPVILGSQFLLPPVRHQDMHKKCMVIDLDETLVHSSFKVNALALGNLFGREKKKNKKKKAALKNRLKTFAKKLLCRKFGVRVCVFICNHVNMPMCYNYELPGCNNYD